MKQLMVAAALAVAFAGCSTVERTSPGIMDKFDVVGGSGGPAVETVLIRNSGWTLFYWIPALFGDVTWDPTKNEGRGGIDGGVCLFRDKCNISDCYETLQKLAEQRNCDLTDVTLVDNSLINLGFTGYVELINCFVESNDVIVSGVLRARSGGLAKVERTK